MQNEDVLKFVNSIVKQFLCNISIKEFIWKADLDVTYEIQEQIIDQTTRAEQVLKYPINVNYQKTFLKRFIENLEKQGSVIHDSLYEEYGRLVAQPLNNVCFKHYPIEKTGSNIILAEDIHLISEGTTGLRTWQASLALSEWILSNSTHFNNKVVIELGSGIGLTGLVLSLHCKPKTVYLTDCHCRVLTLLCENLKTNIGNNGFDENFNRETYLLKTSVNSSAVYVINLAWENVTVELCQKLGHIDKIVAADVVYDKSTFSPLISAVNCIFRHCGSDEFILACTERNSDTVCEFLQLLEKNYKIDDIIAPPQDNFLWPSVPPVKIFSIQVN